MNLNVHLLLLILSSFSIFAVGGYYLLICSAHKIRFQQSKASKHPRFGYPLLLAAMVMNGADSSSRVIEGRILLRLDHYMSGLVVYRLQYSVSRKCSIHQMTEFKR